MKELTRSVYLNLTRKCWSIAQSNAPVQHAARMRLLNVWFHVNENGRQRVIEEQKKYVHAYVKVQCSVPMMRSFMTQPKDQGGESWQVEVTYNPYKAGYFYRRDTGQEVVSASIAYLTEDCKLYCFGVAEGHRNAYSEIKTPVLSAEHPVGLKI